MAKNLQYQEFKPSEKLKDYVKCFGYLQKDVPSGTSKTERVYPAGCDELLFHLGANYKSAGMGDNKLKIHPKYYIFGQTVNPHRKKESERDTLRGFFRISPDLFVPNCVLHL